MSRNTGTFNFAANFEGLLKAPIDAKQLVGTYADLTTPGTWNASGSVWLYDGAVVSVASGVDRGLYYLCDANNYTNTSSWIKVGTGGGTITGATNGIHATGQVVALGGALTGNTYITDALGRGIQYGADYSGSFLNNSLVSKLYVDSVATGLRPKAAVRVTTTSGITLSGLTTIDGIAVQDGDRVLVKNQGPGVGTSSANGVYVVASASTWTRALDFDGTPIGEVVSGTYMWVLTGNTNGGTAWVLVTPDPIIVGSTPMTFSLFAAVSDVLAGPGIEVTMSGGTHYVALDANSLAVVNSAVTGATNGLTKSGRNIILGGSLTGNTNIGVSTNKLRITGNTNSQPFGICYAHCSDGYGVSPAVVLGDSYINGVIGNSALAVTSGRTCMAQVCNTCCASISLDPTALVVTTNNSVGNPGGALYIQNTCALIENTDGTSLSSLGICGNCMQIGGNGAGFKGVEYCGNYSSNFSNCSLVTKEYVLAQTSGATGTITGATNGLSVSGMDIKLGGTLTGDTIIKDGVGGYKFIISGDSTYSAFIYDPGYQGINVLGQVLNPSRACFGAGNGYMESNQGSAINCCSNICQTVGGIVLKGIQCASVCTEVCLIQPNITIKSIDGANCNQIFMQGDTNIDIYSNNKGICLDSLSGTTVTNGLCLQTTPVTGVATDQILVWNSVDKKVKKVSVSSVGGITGATNGVCKSGGNVVLGGTLTGHTQVSTSSYCLAFGGAGRYIMTCPTGSIVMLGDCTYADNYIRTSPACTTINAGVSGILKLCSASGSFLLNCGSDGAIYCGVSNTGIKYSAVTNGWITSQPKALVTNEWTTGYTQSAISCKSNTVNVYCQATCAPYSANTSSDFIGAMSGSCIWLPPVPKPCQRIIVADVSGQALNCMITIIGTCCFGCGFTGCINNADCATINTDYGSVTLINNGNFWSTVAFIN